jgi:hypothetical protein
MPCPAARVLRICDPGPVVPAEGCPSERGVVQSGGGPTADHRHGRGGPRPRPRGRTWSWPDLLRHTCGRVGPARGVSATCAWWPPSRTRSSSGRFSPTSGSRPRCRHRGRHRPTCSTKAAPVRRRRFFRALAPRVRPSPASGARLCPAEVGPVDSLESRRERRRGTARGTPASRLCAAFLRSGRNSARTPRSGIR